MNKQLTIEDFGVEIPGSNVEHPKHYNAGNIECIDAMESAFGIEAVQNFCALNAFKYIWRFLHKNGVEDVDKAVWYLEKYIELELKKIKEGLEECECLRK